MSLSAVLVPSLLYAEHQQIRWGFLFRDGRSMAVLILDVTARLEISRDAAKCQRSRENAGENLGEKQPRGARGQLRLWELQTDPRRFLLPHDKQQCEAPFTNPSSHRMARSVSCSAVALVGNSIPCLERDHCCHWTAMVVMVSPSRGQCEELTLPGAHSTPCTTLSTSFIPSLGIL